MVYTSCITFVLTFSLDIAKDASTIKVLISIIGVVYVLPPPQHVFQVFHNYVSCYELSQSFAVKILDDELGDIGLDEIRAGGNELVQRSVVPIAQGIIPPVKEIGI